MNAKFLVFGFFIGILTLCPVQAFAQEGMKVIAHKDIPYVAGSKDPEQRLDLFVPDISAVRLSRPMPVHIFVHGGGWNHGNKDRTSDLFGKFYASRGYILVMPNYRLAPENKYPDFAQDLAAMVRWVKDNIAEYGGDPDHIVLSGHSAGAHLVALIGTHPELLREQGLSLDAFRAVVPVDTASFNLTIDPYGRKGNKGLITKRQIKMRENAFGMDKAVYADASPTLRAQQAKPGKLSPFMLFVTSTRPDAIDQTSAFLEALKTSGNAAGMSIIDGASHADMARAIIDPRSEIAQTILKFLQEQE